MGIDYPKKMWILCLFWMKGKLDIFLARFAESGYNERQDIQKGETEMISNRWKNWSREVL